MTLIASKYPKARKNHRCDWCGQPIQKGESYQRSCNTYDGDLFTWKNHSFCMEVAQRLDMWDDCDEGLSEGYFTESIQERYAKVMSEKQNTLWESEGFVMPDFKGQLIFVLNDLEIPHTLLP